MYCRRSFDGGKTWETFVPAKPKRRKSKIKILRDPVTGELYMQKYDEPR